MTVEGLDQLARAFDRLTPDQRDLDRILNAAGLVLEGHVKRNIVEMDIIDTGAFLNGVAVRDVASGADSAEKTVGSHVEYATYLELGTSKMPARPSHRRAFDEGKEQANEAARAEAEAQVRRAAG